jgi:hypothetical protein
MGEDAKDRTAPRVKPQAGATRCPFCHDECAPEVDVAVCRGCLSRHHAACWEEGAACASCGAAESLCAPAVTARPDAVGPTWLGIQRGEVGLWIVLIATSGLVLGLVQGVSAFQRFFAEAGFELPALTRLALVPAGHPTLVALALIAWVATAAMARRHRRAFVTVVLLGVTASVPVLLLALFLPVVALLQKL